METFHSSFLLWDEIWRSLFLNLICPALISVILKWSLGLQKLFVSCCFLMAPWILSFSIFKSWWVFRWWSKVNSFQLQARCTKNWCIIFFVIYIFSWKQTTSVLPPRCFESMIFLFFTNGSTGVRCIHTVPNGVFLHQLPSWQPINWWMWPINKGGKSIWYSN